MKAKDMELRSETSGYGGIDHGYNGVDLNKVSNLRAEEKRLTVEINAAAQKYGIPACCRC